MITLTTRVPATSPFCMFPINACIALASLEAFKAQPLLYIFKPCAFFKLKKHLCFNKIPLYTPSIFVFIKPKIIDRYGCKIIWLFDNQVAIGSAKYAVCELLVFGVRLYALFEHPIIVFGLLVFAITSPLVGAILDFYPLRAEDFVLAKTTLNNIKELWKRTKTSFLFYDHCC